MLEPSRRRALQAVAGGAVGTLAGCLGDLAFSTSSTDPTVGAGLWTQSRADARNTGTSEAATFPSEPPERDWEFDVEETVESGWVDDTYDVVVGDGTLYTALIRQPANRQSATETTVEPATGTPDRTTNVTREPRPSKTLEVYAVDAATGDRLWQRAVELGDVVQKQARAIALSDVGLHVVRPLDASDDGTLPLFTFDRDDGAVQRRETPLVSDLTVGENRLYGIGFDTEAEQLAYFGVDPSTGAVDWRADTDEILWPENRLAVGDDRLVGLEPGRGETRRLVAYSLDDGSRSWESDLLRQRGVPTPHAVGSGTVVTLGEPGDVERGGTIVGVGAGDGTTLFTHEVDGRLGLPPVVVDRMALFGTIDPLYEEDGECVLHGVDLSDGTLRYGESLGNIVPGPPVSDGERVLVPGSTTTVVDPEDGSTLWRESKGVDSDRTTTARSGADTIAGNWVVYPGDGRLFGRGDSPLATEETVRGYGTR